MALDFTQLLIHFEISSSLYFTIFLQNEHFMTKILLVDLLHDYGSPERGLNFIGQKGFKNSLERLGKLNTFYYDTYFSKKEDPELQKSLLKFATEWQPDIIFFIICGEHFSLSTLDLLKKNHITINWFGDDTWRFNTFTTKYAPHFSFSITTDKFSLPLYNKLPNTKVLLSQWGAVELNLTTQENKIENQFSVSFVGGHNYYRSWFIQKLKEYGIIVSTFGNGWSNGPVSGERMQEIFMFSKINLNLGNSISYDLRYLLSSPMHLAHTLRGKKHASQIKARNFEIPYFSGFQLTDYVPELEDYFRIGQEIACFSTVEECAKQINYYLQNEEKRKMIATQGHQRTLIEHTYFHRLQKIFTELNIV
jgi:spore maturation protein CgeB